MERTYHCEKCKKKIVIDSKKPVKWKGPVLCTQCDPDWEPKNL